MSSDEDGLPSRNYLRDAPPPPPPLPSGNRSASSSPGVPRAQTKMERRNPKSEELMQLELKNVLDLFREKRHIEIPRTPEVYINQHSTATEVKEWLKAKGFSDRIQKQFSGMSGEELFSLKRNQLEEFCGEKEGRRLDSQITISRNTSGFKTARSSELRAILARARAKADGSHTSEEKTNAKVSSHSSPLRNESDKNVTAKASNAKHIEISSDSSSADSESSDSDDDSKSTLQRMVKEKQKKMQDKRK